MASPARASRAADDRWAAIHDPATPLVVEPEAAPDAPWVADLLARAPFAWRVTGPAGTVAAMLADAPDALRAIVSASACRLARLMGISHVAVRVEGITTNACTRLHADMTDVRLIRTLAGPGTEYATGEDPQAPLARLPTGWIGLFKGRAYPGADGCRHQPCLHRSPPIEHSGERRLVLVIDTARPDSETHPAGAPAGAC